MRRGSGILTLAILGVSCGLPVLAQREEARERWKAFEESVRAAEQARRDGDFVQAENLFKEAVEESKSFGARNVRLGRALDGLADLYYDLGRYEDAEPLYLEALEIWQQLLGPEQPRVATTMHNLAALYLAREETDKAEPLFQRSLAIWEKSLGEGSLEVAVALDAYAALLQRTGRREEAEPLIERARKIRERLASDRE